MLDENVPAAVSHFLAEQGFEVILSRDAVGEGAPDPMVAQAAQVNEAILVSLDRDMRRIQRQLSAANEARFPTLDLIMLACSEPQAAARLQKFLPIIQAEFERISIDQQIERLRIEVGANRLVVCH
ncbi:MAG: DUF5615 family PIN-like protein [Sphingopyxis sp.]|uniref:DUF5615 family PIN-like protein n=1 Tax=Sphingopyxis sp. TaxID=1908224 RepID=UPI003D6D4125